MRKILIFSPFSTLIFFVFLFSASKIFSKTDEVKLKFNLSELRIEKSEGLVEKDRFDKVILKDAHSFAPIGAPDLPVKILRVAVPEDLEIKDVFLVSAEKNILSKEYKIFPVQPEVPLSEMNTGIEFIPPDPLIYQSNKEFPGKLVELGSFGFLCGQKTAEIFLYPLQYIPDQKKLIFYTDFELKFVYKESEKRPLPIYNRSFVGAKFHSDVIKKVVINPEEVVLPQTKFSAQDTLIEYLIIAPTSFVLAFQPLVDWKTRKGILSEIKTVEWITANFSGADEPEKIRNFIRHAYQNYGTIWVLLGGDTQHIPHRIAWAFEYEGDWRDEIPADLYYSDLDGDWNWDGDTIFGEYEDLVDLYPDVFVGRAPAITTTHAQTFVNKVLTYEANPSTDYTTKILLVGEILWDPPYTDGGELKDLIENFYIPPQFDITKLYESLENLSKTSFRLNFNSGKNLINHYAHGSVTGFSLGPDYWYRSDMDALTNSSRLSVLYTISCFSNAFDYDCLGEHSINNPNGGCIAYIGNSRYGWGVPGEPTHGSGPQLDIQFFRYLFAENSFNAGKTLADAKAFYVPLARKNSGRYLRWALYALNLLGDPELCIWTDSLSELIVSHPKKLKLGTHQINVEVTNEGFPLSGAMVCLNKAPEIYLRDTTGSAGQVDFSFCVSDTSEISLVITSQNFIPFQYPIEVVNYQPGDANGDSLLNLADVIFIANYILKNGPEPDPLELADADCNDIIDLADAILIANYCLKGGPAPCSF